MRRDISRLLNPIHGTGSGSTLRGTVVEGPANVASPMRVSIKRLASDIEYEVPATNWMPRGALVPTVGDIALVVLDDFGDAWVPAWGPLPKFILARPMAVTAWFQRPTSPH
jgi:hypothetical protein